MKKTILTVMLTGLFVLGQTGCSSDKSGDGVKSESAQTGKTGQKNLKEPVSAAVVKKLERPGVFPAESVKALKDKFSEGTELSPAKVRNFSKAWDVMMAQRKAGSDEQDLDKALKAEGFNGWNDLKGTAAKVSTSIMVIKSMESMEKTNGNKVARGMAETIASSMISQGGISVEDLKFVYGDWDAAVAVSNKLSGK
ncbi:MAG: hypothetical protein U9O97_04110 [Elusimicrobiota bacterium]|nr:hypothetical protein [Elusimicrobiota bacterium]